MVREDVTRLEKAFIHVRYKQSKVVRATDLRYVFRDCAKDAPEPVAFIHQSCEAEIEHADPDLGRFVLSDPVPFSRTSPIVVQGKSYTINSQKGLILEVKEPIPEYVDGTIRQTIVKASVEDILQEFKSEWAPRWQKVQDLESSQWNQVFHFVRARLPRRNWDFPPWTIDAFRNVVKHKKVKAAVGADGITRDDLLALPSSGVERMLQVYARAENQGQWPHQLTVGIVNSLEKSPGCLSVSGFRPIVVYPFLYRVWSSYRSKQFLKQFLDVAPAGLRGGLPCCQAKSIWYQIAVRLEVDHHMGASTIGVVADLVKAFNAIPRIPVYAIMQAMGVPDWVIKSWGAFVSQQCRRFKVRGSLGDAIPSSSGFPEGCGWSVCAMAAIDLALDIWLQGLEAKPSVFTFVDDWQILHSSLSSHDSVLNRLDAFVDALQMDLDKKKTFVWGSSTEARSVLKGGSFEVVAQCRNLGAQSNFTRRCGNKVLVARLQAMPKTWKLFRSSLASYEKKAIALRMLAWPRALHGISVVRLGKAHFETARTQALRGMRCDRIGAHPLIHLSVLGFSFDPEGWTLLQTFKDAREFGDPDHFRHFLLQSFVSRSAIPANGPVALLRDRAESLGWRVTSDGVFGDEVGRFDFFVLSIGELQKRIAWSWPNIMAREVAHRSSFAGIQWADLGEVQQILKHFSQTDQIYYRCALDGTMYTQHGKQHWVQSDANLCQWCHKPDNFQHRLWECENFEDLRTQIPVEVLQSLHTFPSCVRNHGWPVRLESQVAFQCLLNDIPEVTPERYQLHQCQTDRHDLFIDGACILPDDGICRLAAFAVTVAQPWISTWEHSVVVAGHVPGQMQSPYRAELWALLHAVQIAVRLKGTVRVWTDCGGLLACVRAFHHGDRQVKQNQHHSDLWSRVVEALRLLGDRVSFHKVVSHISPGSGVTSVEQWIFWHNGLVDNAASAMNHRRSEEFLTTWSECCRAVAFNRQVFLEVARHIVRVGKRANESKQRPVREQDRARELKYGSTQNTIDVPLVVSISPGFSQKYGEIFSQTLQQWWLQTGHRYLKRDSCLRWISFTQLFCDYLLGTNHPGIFLIAGKWGVDPASLTSQQFPNFAQRSRWFQMCLRAFWKQLPLKVVSKLQRPSSSSLACWVSSVLICWDDWRMEQVDAEIHRQLGRVSQSLELEKLGFLSPNPGMVLSCGV